MKKETFSIDDVGAESGNLSCIENRESIPMNDKSLLPEGEYKAQVFSSETVPTASGGVMLKVAHSILEPVEHKGRVIYTTFNIVNASAKAQQIARSMLAELAFACGFERGTIPADSCHLHDKPHGIKVVVTPSDPAKISPKTGEPYPARNDVKKFIPESKLVVSVTADDTPEFLK